VDGGWPYFVRMAKWAEEIGLEVWPDVHTAPGSQNGFDNSGHLLDGPTCKNWGENATNVNRSIEVVREIASRIRTDGLTSVRGFGTLNEPFVDCDPNTVRAFNDATFQVLRKELGPDVKIYIGDMFNAKMWNDGFWEDRENTFLDSHYYHVFARNPRTLSPRQHIAYVCRKNKRDTVGCCYSDHPKNTKPAKGISRIIGEWSASPDTLVVDKLDQVMDEIAKTGVAAEFTRQIPTARQDFLRHFVQAQVVTYEAANEGVSKGWFYWTFKTEGGAFAEWNYLRGVSEGWIPKILPPNQASHTTFGTCEDIMLRTIDNPDILHEFPPMIDEGENWQGTVIDDDLVVSHGDSLHVQKSGNGRFTGLIVILTICFSCIYYCMRWKKMRDERLRYEQVPNVSV